MTQSSQATSTQQFRGRIGLTLITSFVLLAIVPVLAVLTFGLNLTDQRVRERTVDQMESQADVKANDIGRWLESSRAILVLLLSNSDQHERMAAIAVSDRPLTTAVTLQQTFLSEQLSAQNTFSEYFIYNSEGVIRVSTDDTKIGLNISNQPYFGPGLGGETIQFPFYEPDNSTIQMLAMQPIRNESDEQVGVLAGRLRLEALSDVMTTRVGMGETGETYLVMEADNRLITASRFEGYPIGEPYTSAGIERVLAGENGFDTYPDYRGIPVIGFYRWLPELQAGMLAEIEEAEALLAIEEARLSGIVAAIGVIAVAIAIGGGLTLWLTRPVTRLTKVATAVIEGDYSQHTPVTRHNEIGQLTHAFNTMTDKLVSTINDLDQRVRELGIANANAQDAARLKDEFLAVMSHELRTPLNASIGLLGLLKMGKRLTPEDEDMVNRARANNERLMVLINNILDLSRFEAGRMDIISTDVNLHKIVQKLHSEMEVLAQQKQLDFNIQIEDDVPPVIRADIDGITKIISNLLSNALKFTERGRVDLHIFTEGNQLTIQVTDTGIGIPPHLQETIFESFRQADASPTRAYGGSGLGLSIVQKLCKAMDGSIRVESTVGQGSRFIVNLPLLPQIVAES
jgi:signal transduction histidine kinase